MKYKNLAELILTPITITTAAAFLFVFFTAISVFACDSSTFNFFQIYQGQTYKANINSFKPLEDSIQKFCNFSAAPIKAQNSKSGNSEEISVILKSPVILDEANFKLDDGEKKAYLDSIETRIRYYYSFYNIKLYGREEAKKIFESIGQTDENFLMTPEISNILHDKFKIYAFLNIAISEMNSWNGYSFNLRSYSDDRRDIEYRNYSRVNMRYKLTECKSGDILWIDEVPGIAEDIFFMTFFEKARPLFLKKECTNFSVISESSCIK
ncbi:MAG TPA: hypothetical protein PKK26_09590 [Candidatus Wallbacteria bacterium]|nr:hypothetical protein [Candidatus Wallbacteria bacterium]